MKKALVIEDTPDNMELITFILEKNGYKTVQAWTGQEGVDKAIEESPDFIILDIRLPDIDGPEVLSRIHSIENLRHIPVIAMTSYAMAGDREKLLAAGSTGYIEKPINPETVMKEVEQILGSP